jgi:hypothetical protein
VSRAAGTEPVTCVTHEGSLLRQSGGSVHKNRASGKSIRPAKKIGLLLIKPYVPPKNQEEYMITDHYYL